MAKSNQQRGLLQIWLEEHGREEKKNTLSFSNVNTLFLFFTCSAYQKSVTTGAERQSQTRSLVSCQRYHPLLPFLRRRLLQYSLGSRLPCKCHFSLWIRFPPTSFFFCCLFFYALRHAHTLSSLALLFKKSKDTCDLVSPHPTYRRH